MKTCLLYCFAFLLLTFFLHQKVDDEFTGDVIGGVVSGVRSQCCHDFSSAHIIKHSSLLSCNQDKWQLLLQVGSVRHILLSECQHKIVAVLGCACTVCG